MSSDSSYQKMIDGWDEAKFSWDQKTLIGVGGAMLDRIRELDAWLSVEQETAHQWNKFIELMGDDSYTEAEPEEYVKQLDDAEQKLEAIRGALNTPNTTDEYVVQEVIRVMGLQMGDHGWEALSVE